jgi:hypothetical protein
MNRLWKNILLGAVIVGAPVFIYAAWKTSRAGYQSAGYTVHSTSGPFELREYETLALVSAPMPSLNDRSMDRGFNQLFKYITGNNMSKSKIAMTTPVLINRDQEGDQPPSMSFVLPREIATTKAPLPADDSVTLNTMTAGTFASFRFKGNRTRESEQAAVKQLRSWIDQQSLKEAGPPQFAYYDPPWTPSFLRRNEVLIRLADG